MPAYRFSWDLFDERSLAAFAADLGFHGPANESLAYLKTHVSRPSDSFVQSTKRSIAAAWLPQHGRIGAAIVRELFDIGIGPMGKMPEDADGCARYVDRCRNSSGLRGRLMDRLISFGDRDKIDDYSPEGDFVPRFGTVAPARQPPDNRRAYPHQLEAWAAMDQNLAAARTSGVFKGVVVMPTGAGKTRTAVHWLLRQWVNDGGHVLWLAHRDELLRQAARTFYELAGLAPKRDKLRIRCAT
ncbi:MAG: DEAD/DEAH box helicase family protein [Luteitalea sp.]